MELILKAAEKAAVNISGAKGTKNHSNLYNLDYESSGHTGFQKALTFDSTPTSGSTNPVTSGGIRTALTSKANASSVYTRTQTDTALGKKANKSDVYTITEVDNALGTKANVNDVYTKTQTDNIIKSKMSTVYKAKGSLGFIGSPITVTSPEVGDVYNIIGDESISKCLLFNNFDFSSSPQTVTVQDDGCTVGFGLLHLRSDTTGENPPTITLRYNNVSKTFDISYLDKSSGTPFIHTAANVYDAFDIPAGTSYVHMDLISIQNNWIDVPNGANVVYTDVGWDILSGTIDLSNYYTKLEIINGFQGKTAIVNMNGEGGNILVLLAGMNNSFWSYLNLTSDITSISIEIIDGEYSLDFAGSMTFKTGSTPPQVSYTNNSKTLVWVGSECSISGSSSVFAPVANKVYDIVFYFNGAAFVGLVNGYALPAEE